MAAVMALLAGSFAIWGINDIFRGFGRAGLAKIGDTEIPIEQFRQDIRLIERRNRNRDTRMLDSHCGLPFM